MKSGQILRIHGGNASGTLTGNTLIDLTGGSVVEVNGGGGAAAANVTGNVRIMISGTARVFNVFGTYNAPVGGNTSVIMSGGAVLDSVIGGGFFDSATVGGSSSVTISGGEIRNTDGQIIGGGYMNAATVGTVRQSDPTSMRTYRAGSTVSVKILGGTINATVYGQYGGEVNGDVEITLSGGTVSSRIIAASQLSSVDSATVRVSGSFSTTGDGVIELANTSNRRVEITGELNGTEQNVKLRLSGDVAVGTPVAHAANSAYANAAKFTFTDGSSTRPLLAQTNVAGGSDIIVAYPASVSFDKNDVPWSDHGFAVTLYNGGLLIATLSGTGATMTGAVAEPDLYDIYINGDFSGTKLLVLNEDANTLSFAYYTVSFAANGGTGTPPETRTVAENSTLEAPSAASHSLVKTGFAIGGWYTDAECTSEWNFAIDTVTQAHTLYPKWLRTEKALSAFSLGGVSGAVNELAKTVSVSLPYGTDVSALVATFTASDGAVVRVGGARQTSGVSANDFTTAETYSVYSESSPASEPARYTVTVTLVRTAPAISAQPASQAATEGETATFSVTATGNPAPSYQWQLNAGSGWTDISGATDASYTTGATTTAMNGYKYRCVITNGAGSAESAEATLTVTAAPAITYPEQPRTVTVLDNGPATLSVRAQNATAYQWYVDRGRGFEPIEGATSDSYTAAAVTTENSGYKYYCAVTGAGVTVISPIFTLNVTTQPDIPETGESSASWLWISLLALIGLAAVVAALPRLSTRRKPRKA